MVQFIRYVNCEMGIFWQEVTNNREQILWIEKHCFKYKSEKEIFDQCLMVYDKLHRTALFIGNRVMFECWLWELRLERKFIDNKSCEGNYIKAASGANITLWRKKLWKAFSNYVCTVQKWWIRNWVWGKLQFYTKKKFL
jgi:hypothetical protein